MKILHTSDWHLGRTLHGENLHEYQREFQDFLLAKVRETGAHALVIAGDIYDRSVPPVEAVELLHESLAALAEETTVILTPGNHDSAVRLGFGAKLMRSGIHILADVEGIEHPVSVADEHGEVLFFGLPFLDPDLARYSLAPKGVTRFLARTKTLRCRRWIESAQNSRLSGIREASCLPTPSLRAGTARIPNGT